MPNDDTIEATIKYPGKAAAKVYKSWAEHFEFPVKFHQIDHANFTKSMALAVLPLDNDHCLYVLAPIDWLEADNAKERGD